MTYGAVTYGAAAYSVDADKDFLRVAGPALPADGVLSVLLHGRRIWTFRMSDDGVSAGGGQLTVRWPLALAERLAGTAELTVLLNGTPLTEACSVDFDTSGESFVLEEPGTGIPQVVNKWGRIGRSFEGRDGALLEAVLDETEKLIDLIRKRLGLELFVTGGTLLGPVRDGAIMPNDDDADLAYLSAHTNPSDVVLESFAVERLLKAEGYEAVRHSGGHLQLMFPGGAIADRFYIDIFTYFTVNGWFHGTFHARELAERVPVFPLRPLDVNGRMLPGPAEPEKMLAAIYGSGWRTPDPTFRFVTPPEAGRRFHGWLNSFDADRENWEDHHRSELAGGRQGEVSEFARRVCSGLQPGSRVLDLGCGLGADSRFFADQGHHVLGVDYSRPAVHAASALPSRHPDRLRFKRANLRSLREAAPLLKFCSTPSGPDSPVDVYARFLLDAMGAGGWDTCLGLVRQVLRAGGGRGFLEVQTGQSGAPTSWIEYGPVDWELLQHQLRRYHLDIEDCGEQPSGPAGGTTTLQLTVKEGK